MSATRLRLLARERRALRVARRTRDVAEYERALATWRAARARRLELAARARAGEIDERERRTVLARIAMRPSELAVLRAYARDLGGTYADAITAVIAEIRKSNRRT